MTDFNKSARTALLLCVALMATLPVTAQAPTKVRIGAWNIEWLGVPGSRSGVGKNVSQKPADIADYVKKSGVDVLALEEICDTTRNDNKLTNKSLDTTFATLNNGGAQWKYLLFPKPGGETTQVVGFAWNAAKVKLVQPPTPVNVAAVADETVWRRTPYAAKFTAGAGKTDFVAIVLHLKSNRGSSNAGKAARKKEAESLAGQMTAIRQQFADQDIVILGDLNTLTGNDPGVTPLTTAGFRDLNAGDEDTYVRGGNANPFDRILVPKNQSEFGATKQVVYRTQYLSAMGWTQNDFTKRLSDHHIIYTDITVKTDDDN